MSDVTRYTTFAAGGGSSGVEVKADGHLVKYSDYDAQAKEIEQHKKRIAELEKDKARMIETAKYFRSRLEAKRDE